MNTQFGLLAALAVICSGCATPPEPQTAAASAAPAPAATNTAPTKPRSRTALTGSRLAPLDEDDTGSSTVGAVTGDDYRRDNDTRIKILNESGSGALNRGQ